MSDFVNKNIDNLTSLWRTVGTCNNGFHHTCDFDYAYIRGSQWPNRVWFTHPATVEPLNCLSSVKSTLPGPMAFPYWVINENDPQKDNDMLGFQFLFEQIGMSLIPERQFNVSNAFTLQQVDSESLARKWSELFQKSFGYLISAASICASFHSVNYYVVYRENTEVGTAISFITGSVFGIHALGVVPEHRQQGIAIQVMRLLLNQAQEARCKLVTLQASSMGRHMYLKLGFEEQFLIKNYALPPSN